MNTPARIDSAINSSVQSMFTVQVLSNEGQLLSEYSLTREEHHVATLAAAEQCAVARLSDYHGEHLVIVVSEETLTKLRQVQLKLIPASHAQV